MQEQTNTPVENITPEVTPNQPNEKAHDTLWKFMLLFMIGCSIFILFISFVGRSPFSLNPRSEMPVAPLMNDNEISEENMYETVPASDYTKDESEVTSEVITEINNLDTTNEEADYNSNQLNELQQ